MWDVVEMVLLLERIEERWKNGGDFIVSIEYLYMKLPSDRPRPYDVQANRHDGTSAGHSSPSPTADNV